MDKDIKMGGYYYGVSEAEKKRKKIFKICGISAAVLLVGYLLFYFCTGWTYKINETISFVRTAKTYMVAEYSDTSYNAATESVETDYWTEPASEVNHLKEENGKIVSGDYEMHGGRKFPQVPPRWDVDPSSFDGYAVKRDELCYVYGDEGVYKCNVTKYHDLFNANLTKKKINVVYHHKKFWAYEVKDSK